MTLLGITFIQPASPAAPASGTKEDWQGTKPFGLLYLAAAFRGREEYRLSIVDLSRPEYRGRTPEEVLANDDSAIFGLTATTYSRFEAVAVARAVKRAHPRALIVAGGVHFMHCPEDTLDHVPEIDVVVRGEGERTMVELAEAVRTGTDWRTTRGIVFRRDGVAMANPPQVACVDIDALPYHHDRYTWEQYPEYLYGVAERVKAASVMSSRGCPFECIFCAKQGTGYRTRSVAVVLDEILALKRSCGVEGINFLDLSLTASPRHVSALCQELRSRAPGLLWWAESRANIPLSLLDEMRGAGCVSLAIGAESASPRVLEKLKKRITPAQITAFCRHASRLGIRVQCYFMYSHPDEQPEDARMTLELIGSLMEYAACSIQPSMIFPGTELERLARTNGILPADFSWYTPYESPLARRLGQLANCPLYVDRIPADLMPEIQTTVTGLAMAKQHATASLGQLARKAFRRLVVERRPLPSYVDAAFLKRYINNKLGTSMKPPPTDTGTTSEPPGATFRSWEYAKRGDYHRDLDPNWPYTPTYLRKMAFVRRTLERLHGPGNRILDAGCGEGVLVEEYRKQGWDIVGLDQNYESDLVRRGDILAMPFAEASFDIVLLLDVFEHVAFAEQAKALAEIRRVLRPGGHLVLSAPNLAHLNSRFELMLRGRVDRSDNEVNHPGERPLHEYRRLLEAQGFVIDETRGITLTLPLVYRQMICRWPARLRWLHDLLEPLATPALALLDVFVCRRS